MPTDTREQALVRKGMLYYDMLYQQEVEILYFEDYEGDLVVVPHGCSPEYGYSTTLSWLIEV